MDSKSDFYPAWTEEDGEMTLEFRGLTLVVWDSSPEPPGWSFQVHRGDDLLAWHSGLATDDQASCSAVAWVCGYLFRDIKKE